MAATATPPSGSRAYSYLSEVPPPASDASHASHASYAPRNESGFAPAKPRRDSFLPFPGPPSTLGQVTEVRSTLLATSLQSLRTHGLFERYARHLKGQHRELVLTAVAGSWLPIDAALAHYEACEALRLEPAFQLTIGMDVGDRVHGTFLGLMVRTAKTVGVTPWLALAQSAKLYGRLFHGGGISVSELGPKEARVEIVGNALCDLDYFRNGVRGVYQAATRLFCSKVYVNEIARGTVHHGMTMRVSWA